MKTANVASRYRNRVGSARAKFTGALSWRTRSGGMCGPNSSSAPRFARTASGADQRELPKGSVPRAHRSRKLRTMHWPEVPVPPHRRRGSGCSRLGAARGSESITVTSAPTPRAFIAAPRPTFPLPKTTNERPERSEWPKCAKPRMNPSPVPRVVSMSLTRLSSARKTGWQAGFVDAFSRLGQFDVAGTAPVRNQRAGAIQDHVVLGRTVTGDDRNPAWSNRLTVSRSCGSSGDKQTVRSAPPGQQWHVFRQGVVENRARVEESHAGEWLRRAPHLGLLDQRRMIRGVVGPVEDAAQESARSSGARRS